VTKTTGGGSSRHLDVEQHQVGLFPLDQLHSPRAVLGLTDEFHALDVHQEALEALASEGFVVDD
jgi:hypothetical protein